MIANRDPYLQIATKFGLNQRTVNTHGKKHVLPFIQNVELQVQAEILTRVRTYRDEVNLPLPEKSKHIENRLWLEFDQAETLPERMLVMREINKQQTEQAKLAGDYTKDKENPKDIVTNITRYLRVLLIADPNIPADELDKLAHIAAISIDDQVNWEEVRPKVMERVQQLTEVQ